MTLSRPVAFGLIAGACLAAAAVYVGYAVRRSAAPASGTTAASTELPVAAPGSLPKEGPWLLFTRASRDSQNSRLAAAPMDQPGSARVISTLRCDRVHMAAGAGVCLAANRGIVTTYRAIVFDERFESQAELPLAGIPSRTQVSPDGRLAGVTVFVTGHSYAEGGFSTRSSIVDLETGRWLVEDLETFGVRRRGELVRSPDFNFWGVTFTRSGRTFFATLGTKTETMLVKGDLDAKMFDVVAERVECPSLSPDNQRIVFKERAGGFMGPARWRLFVMDLESLERHPVAETRNVDDQVQWLDNDRLLYALAGESERAGMSDEWTVPADGSGTPEMILPDAYSAAVIR